MPGFERLFKTILLHKLEIPMNFKNKIVLVTGANRGIGKEIISALLNKGVKKIYAASRDIANLPDFSDARVVPITLDITNREQISAAAKIANDIDILVNNAGVAAFTSLIDGPLDLLEADMNTNYYGTLNMIREFVPVLAKKETSAIVNMVTIGAFVNFPILGGYCASKSALFSLSQGIRIELAAKNISVHTVNPGPIDTEMAEKFEADKTSPKVTAENIVQALEADEADIFPDPNGKGMFDLWNNNYRDLEKAVYDMHHA